MPTIITKDGTEIYFKDWGPKNAQPIVFHHGWPLSADDWDNQMLYFVGKGYRVIAHDRRGHGRSAQVSDGHDMDHYAADAAAVVEHLDLRNAIHIGHSTGGGEATHYVARHDRTILGKISKRGNRYLRVLFVQAAWVVLIKPKSWERHGLKHWIEAAKKRLHHNVLAIALANKLARIAWSVLARGRGFEASKLQVA